MLNTGILSKSVATDWQCENVELEWERTGSLFELAAGSSVTCCTPCQDILYHQR